MSILNFTGVLLIGIGGLLIGVAIFASALSLLFKSFGRKLESWMGGGWLVIDSWPRKSVLWSAVNWINSFINKAVSIMILNYERSPIFGAIATAIFIVILPLAAFVNMLQGGSPFMLYCYGFICLGIVYQLFTAEIRFNAIIRSAMAGLSAFLLVFALPYYAAWSLTEHLMNKPIFLSVVASVLVANVLYAGTAGLGALVRAGTRTGELSVQQKFIAYVLFAIPAFYILYWLIVFAGSVAYENFEQIHSIRSLIVSVGFGAVSFALIKLLVDRGVAEPDFVRGLMFCLLGLLILIAASISIYLSSYDEGFFQPDLGKQWFSHIPFASIFIFVVIFKVIVAAKILLNSVKMSQMINKFPLPASNLLLGGVGGLVMLIGIGIR